MSLEKTNLVKFTRLVFAGDMLEKQADILPLHRHGLAFAAPVMEKQAPVV